MYPYNIRKNNSQTLSKSPTAKPFNIFCTHNNDESNSQQPKPDSPENTPQTPPPSPDINRYVTEMLIEAIKDERTDAKYYNELANMLEDESDKKILHKIHNDELKHEKIFTEIYELLTGSAPNEEDLTIEEKPISENIAENFANSIFDELKAVEFYRKIMFSFLNQELRDALYEIITDEQAHAQISNYMYSKYK